MTRVRYVLQRGNERRSRPFLSPNSNRVVLPYVHSVEFSRNHAEVTTWTLGKHPVHHYAGVRSQMIELEGRSGVATRFETEGITSVASSDQSGPALFRKLEKFIEDYENEAAAAMRQGDKPPSLILLMLFEQKQLVVEPKTFSFSRTAQASNFSYQYTLHLESHGQRKFETPRGPLDALKAAFELSNTITKAINAVSLKVADATELLQTAKTQLDTFREPLRALTRLGSQVRTYTGAANALVQWPKAFMLDFWFATFELTAAVFDRWAALPFTDRQAVRSTMIDAMRPMADAKRATQTALGLNFITLPGGTSTYESQTGAASLSSDPSYTTRQRAIQSFQDIGGGYAVSNGNIVVVYEFIAGDTLPAIAGDLLGDRGRWREIADLNGMTGVNTFSNGSPLIGGTLLFVPAPEGAQLPGLSPNDLYGVDLQLGADGDLVALGEFPQDVAVVRGVDNLVQGLTNRFVTVQGDNGTFPDHGLPRLAGNPGTADRLAEAAIEAGLQLRRDQRIADVQDLAIVDEGDTLVVNSVLRPVIGKAFDITVPFPAT
jgi:hypothetical protein